MFNIFKWFKKKPKKPIIRFHFDSIAVSRTIDGELVAILHLVEPIDEVISSQGIIDADNNHFIPMVCMDVTEIKVHQNLFDNFDWDIDTEIGTYEGEFILDVTRSGEVWLTDIPFAEIKQ